MATEKERRMGKIANCRYNKNCRYINKLVCNTKYYAKKCPDNVKDIAKYETRIKKEKKKCLVLFVE